jgi:hypothetical protein
VPDRDYFACAEAEIAGTTSDLTVVGGRVVYGARDFAALDDGGPPPAMPDWSPVRGFGGYGAWRAREGQPTASAFTACGCASACRVHGHDHARAASASLPVSDLSGFWGALGCACWAV